MREHLMAKLGQMPVAPVATRAAYGLILSPPFCTGAMLVDPDECAVDEDIFEIGIVAERLENALPSALPRRSA